MHVPVSSIHAELWRRFGSQDFRAEWDGNLFGGGKLSQRFWEYHAAARLLELEPYSSVLEIGGYSEHAGGSFFAELLSGFCHMVHVIDPKVEPSKTRPNIEAIEEQADYKTLSYILKNRNISHISCVSVLEHIAPEVRTGIVRAINEHFSGFVFVATLEFDSFGCHFEHQLTPKTLGAMFAPLTRFYPDVFESCPVMCENARLDAETPDHEGECQRPFSVPLWRPLALRFVGDAYTNRKKVMKGF